MCASTLRRAVCWLVCLALPSSLLGQEPPTGPTTATASAILRAQGGVLINNYEAPDSSAVFAGDVIETRTGATAALNLDGASVVVAPESLGKFQGDVFELDHGVVHVVTSKGYRVRVNCLLVTPVINDWTDYTVSDVNGKIHVEAAKNDVNVTHSGKGKDAKEPTPEATQTQASVHQGEQKDYGEAELCGAAAPQNPLPSHLSPKWIGVGAGAAGGVIVLLLVKSGPKHPISPSNP